MNEKCSGCFLSRPYVYGDTLLSQQAGGISHYYLYDGMNSVCGLADSARTLTDAYTYDAYGNLLDNSGPTINPYLYRGEQYDAELNAYYLRARYYQPDIGRFLTTDPVEGFPNSPMTLHRYLYGYDNPNSYIDPSGSLTTLEKVMVAGIVTNLAVMAVGNFSEPGQNVMYPSLAQNVYPEKPTLSDSTLQGSFLLCSSILIMLERFSSRLPLHIL